WSPAMREPFGPLLPGCVFLPLDGDALLDFARREEIAAVFLECVQGNSGVHPIPAGLASTAAKLRRERGVLIVADEIQTGLGRTGRYFSYEHWGLAPDIITMGKGIGGGLPLGAALFCGLSPFGAGDHGSTFAPNPVSLAAGRAVLAHVTPKLLEEVERKGERLRKGLERLSWAKEVRGLGLMAGIGTDRPDEVASRAFKRGLLVNRAGGEIRLLPALTSTERELDEILSRLDF
ncbi:MAG: aminotransferase class III-fold pyridoxal phosphate-dependent enzyme, partial [Synergistota bacterium]|nr:aminotransferase class III-fold pyridoxal phosphate-dependent enzyme [Synergistota bacterium]